MDACETILRLCLDNLIQLLKSASTTKKKYRKPTKIGRNQSCFFSRNICFCVVQFRSTLDSAFFYFQLLAFSNWRKQRDISLLFQGRQVDEVGFIIVNSLQLFHSSQLTVAFSQLKTHNNFCTTHSRTIQTLILVVLGLQNAQLFTV